MTTRLTRLTTRDRNGGRWLAWAVAGLGGRLSLKSWASGEMMLPKDALAFLVDEGVRFGVEGPATYERLAALRDSAPAEVQ